MREELISFDVSKLAVEKGIDDFFDHCGVYWLSDKRLDLEEKYLFEKEIAIPAPTQSFLQKWIREKHHIDVIVSSNLIGYSYILYKRYPPKNITTTELFEHYEDALESALKRALEEITEKDPEITI
jgi:hypothetical protein